MQFGADGVEEARVPLLGEVAERHRCGGAGIVSAKEQRLDKMTQKRDAPMEQFFKLLGRADEGNGRANLPPRDLFPSERLRSSPHLWVRISGAVTPIGWSAHWTIPAC